MSFNPNMLRQIQKQVTQMQEKMAKEQEKLANETFEVSAGGGAVTVQIRGDNQIQKITLQKDAVDPDDVEMLEDLLMGAVNEALRKVESEREERLGSLTKGLNLPPGMGF